MSVSTARFANGSCQISETQLQVDENLNYLKGLNQGKITKKSVFHQKIVFLILDIHVRNKKSGISSLYLA